MVYIYTYTEVEKNIKKDSLSDFMKELTFVPHAFGHQCNNPAATCSDRITGDFELICIVGGESTITIGNKVYNCFAGDSVLITPFTMHKIQTPASNPHDNYWIHFDLYPFHLQKNFISSLTGNAGNILHLGLTDELLNLYSLLKNEFDKDKPGRMHTIGSILQLIIIEILREKNRPVPIEASITAFHAHETEIVRKSLDFIQDNLYRAINLTDIINHLHISESYLFKSFSTVIQMPPNQFIQLIKIKKAEELLKITDYSIKEISDMLGFSSPYYFSNVFKKYYKVSPRSYIQNIKLSDNRYSQLLYGHGQ